MTLGRGPDCDLVIDHPSVAPRHAVAELTRDGAIQVSSAGPEAHIRLQRQARQVDVQRVILCVDDRLFLGSQEVALARISGLFGVHAGARLKSRPSAAPSARPARPVAQTGTQPVPRRNPLTGKIEN